LQELKWGEIGGFSDRCLTKVWMKTRKTEILVLQSATKKNRRFVKIKVQLQRKSSKRKNLRIFTTFGQWIEMCHKRIPTAGFAFHIACEVN
jgi:hypothetical protein